MLTTWQALTRLNIIKIACCLSLLLASSVSHAVLTDNFTIGNPKAVALGHAVTADPPGIDAVHFNPAGLAKLKGRQSHYKMISGDFSIELEFGDYMDERQQTIDDARATGNFPDSFFYDEARNTTSETEGATLMLPFAGMTDIPMLLGITGGASYSPPASDMTFATNVYTPLAVGFNRADDDPGRFIGSRLSLFRLTYFSPSIGYQVSDTLAIGAAVTFNYSGVGLDLNFRGPNAGLITLEGTQQTWCEEPGQAIVDICGGRLGLFDELGELSVAVEDPISLGFNFGVLWDPYPWLTLGMVYQSESEMNMKGDFTWSSSDQWVGLITDLTKDPAYQAMAGLAGVLGWSLPEGKPNLKGEAKMDMKMPEHYAFGLSLRLTPSLKINADYKFTAWSAWPELPLAFSEPIDVLRLAAIAQPHIATETSVKFPFGLEDSWNYAIGIEYQYNDQLALRMGYEPRATSVPNESITPLLPVGDGTFYGLGFEYKPESGGIWDVGIGYFESEVKMLDGSSQLGNSIDPTAFIYNPYPGTDIIARLNMFLIEIGYQKTF